jgi:thioredoxin-dependent peroxiredoxin
VDRSQSAAMPRVEAMTTEGPIRFHEWLGDSWGVLFSHPKDFTPVCTTELGYMARIKSEFDKRNVKIIGLSVDPLESHQGWSKDIEEATGSAPNYPMIADADLKVSKLYGMLPAEAGETCEGRTAMDNQTVRNVYVIGPGKKVKLMLSYPMSTGRNFDEVLRVIDSMQLTARHKVATPVNWKHGTIEGRIRAVCGTCVYVTRTLPPLAQRGLPPEQHPSADGHRADHGAPTNTAVKRRVRAHTSLQRRCARHAQAVNGAGSSGLQGPRRRRTRDPRARPGAAAAGPDRRRAPGGDRDDSGGAG